MNPFIGRNFKLNGNQLAKKIGLEIKNNILDFIKTNQKSFNKPINPPKLQIINVGHNIGSLSYIRKKIEIAQQMGIDYHLHQFNLVSNSYSYYNEYDEVQEMLMKINRLKFDKYKFNLEQLKQVKDPLQADHMKHKLFLNYIGSLITKINNDDKTAAVFIQLPLPNVFKSYSQQLINLISPLKDADCLTRLNRMRVLDHKEVPDLLPCTPRGVLKILDQNNIQIQGMNAIMIGRSDLVGKPLSHLLLNRSATTIICHKFTKDVNFFTKDADLIISAAGCPHLVKDVKKGSILIDVGISRDQKGKLSGDISNQAKQNASFYTPVPGGVGPLTVVMLMQNVYHLWKKQKLDQIANYQNKTSL